MVGLSHRDDWKTKQAFYENKRKHYDQNENLRDLIQRLQAEYFSLKPFLIEDKNVWYHNHWFPS